MFIAVLLLEIAGKRRPYKHSAVFDMESFFWTFLYVLFHQKRSTLDDTDTEYFQSMHPSNVSSYKSDSNSKLALLVHLSSPVAATSVLFPLRSFIEELATLAFSLYKQGHSKAQTADDIEIYSEEAEVNAIGDYIRIFERMHSSLASL